MGRGLWWSSWLVTLALGCRDAAVIADAKDETPADCALGCTLDAPCALSRESACEFADATGWALFKRVVGEIQAPEPGSRTELLAFPTKYAGKVEPVRLSDGAFDSEFIRSWQQDWSPDGTVLIFDATNSFFTQVPNLERRLFVSEFGAGVPTPAKRLEGLPVGEELIVDPWEARSEAFTVRSGEELYLVRREGGEFVPSLLVGRDEGIDPNVTTRLCAGGNHVVYKNSAGELVFKSTTTGEGRRYAEYTDVWERISKDSQWLVVTGSSWQDGEEIFTLEVGPCGDGPVITLDADWDGPPYPTFSARSRYLSVEDDYAVRGYVDLAGAPSLRPFPEGTSYFYRWSSDESYAVLDTEDGELITFWPESGESALIGLEEPSNWHSDFLLFYHLNADDEIGSFEVVDPERPDAALAAPVAQDGYFDFSSILVDAASLRLAYAEITPDGARATILDLATGRELANFEFPGALGFTLYSFAADGSGVLASDDSGEFSFYFLPSSGTAPPHEALLISRTLDGDWLVSQPWL
jgi:hypothetical protein